MEGREKGARGIMRVPIMTVTILCCLLVNGGLIAGGRAAGPYAGAIGQAPILQLSLEDAITLALHNNYDLLLAIEAVEESQGVASTRTGALLPNVRAESGSWRQKTFNGVFGGSPTVSTPRNIFDARLRLTQPIFSLNLIQQWRAGRTGVDVAELDAEVARRDTIATAALRYLEALRAEAAVKARESNVKLNRALLKLTRGRKKAGAATGIDVVRAQGQVESERQLLLAARNEERRAELNLVRAMGIADNTRVRLTGSLKLVDVEERPAEDSVMRAMQNRSELKAQTQRVKLAGLTLDAITGERVPSVEVRGDYGLIGEQYDDRLATYLLGAFVNLPLYDGQRDGRYSETKSQLRQEQIRIRNLVQQISVETRDAHQTLHNTREQALVAGEALRFALEEFRLSQKAFSIGTITHFEVIGAQIRVAGTRDAAIEALFNFNAARVNLARAEERMKKIYKPSLRHKVLARAPRGR